MSLLDAIDESSSDVWSMLLSKVSATEKPSTIVSGYETIDVGFSYDAIVVRMGWN